MAQMNWTYVGDSGTAYRVTLYHGPQSGHVLVVVNRKISIIDFFVRESRNYSLLLEDELMQVEIEKGPEGYSYGFTIDEEADTQRNRNRRREAFRRNGAIALVAVLALGLFLWLVLVLHARQEARMTREALPWLHERGQRTLARLGNDKTGAPCWYFAVQRQVFTLPLGTWPDSLAPLRAGDDVLVYYLPRKPSVARTEPAQPGPRRSQRLLDAWWHIQHPNEWPEDWLNDCLLPFLRSDSLQAAQINSPWQRQPAPALPGWLRDQPVLVRKVALNCY